MRIDGDRQEMLVLLVQDDLSTLADFKVIAHGHVVEEEYYGD